jgi:hypothetical protein
MSLSPTWTANRTAAGLVYVVYIIPAWQSLVVTKAYPFSMSDVQTMAVSKAFHMGAGYDATTN